VVRRAQTAAKGTQVFRGHRDASHRSEEYDASAMHPLAKDNDA
jgi:hypothetical protein